MDREGAGVDRPRDPATLVSGTAARVCTLTPVLEVRRRGGPAGVHQRQLGRRGVVGGRSGLSIGLLQGGRVAGRGGLQGMRGPGGGPFEFVVRRGGQPPLRPTEPPLVGCMCLDMGRGSACGLAS